MHLHSSSYVLVSHCALNAQLLRYFFIFYFPPFPKVLFCDIHCVSYAPFGGGTTWHEREKKSCKRVSTVNRAESHDNGDNG